MTQGTSPKTFQSGTISVPLMIEDRNIGVKDEGQLVAGTIGFTVEKGERAPVVEAKQGWVLFVPRGSPFCQSLKQIHLK